MRSLLILIALLASPLIAEASPPVANAFPIAKRHTWHFEMSVQSAPSARGRRLPRASGLGSRGQATLTVTSSKDLGGSIYYRLEYKDSTGLTGHVMARGERGRVKVAAGSLPLLVPARWDGHSMRRASIRIDGVEALTSSQGDNGYGASAPSARGTFEIKGQTTETSVRYLAGVGPTEIRFAVPGPDGLVHRELKLVKAELGYLAGKVKRSPGRLDTLRRVLSCAVAGDEGARRLLEERIGAAVGQSGAARGESVIYGLDVRPERHARGGTYVNLGSLTLASWTGGVLVVDGDVTIQGDVRGGAIVATGNVYVGRNKRGSVDDATIIARSLKCGSASDCRLDLASSFYPKERAARLTTYGTTAYVGGKRLETDKQTTNATPRDIMYGHDDPRPGKRKAADIGVKIRYPTNRNRGPVVGTGMRGGKPSGTSVRYPTNRNRCPVVGSGPVKHPGVRFGQRP